MRESSEYRSLKEDLSLLHERRRDLRELSEERKR